MVWVRVLVGLALTYLLLNGPMMAALRMSGILGANASVITGPGGADEIALGEPFERLRQGDLDWLAERVADVPQERALVQVQAMQAALPTGYQSSRWLSWRRTNSSWQTWGEANSSTRQILTAVFDHEYAAHIVRSDIVLKREASDEPWRIQRFNIHAVQRVRIGSPIHALISGEPMALAAASLALIVPIFMVVVLWTVLLKRRFKLRWVWALVSLVSVGAWTVNLSSGQGEMNALMIQILTATGASWTGSPLDAWMVKVAAPLGAAAAWFHIGFAREEEGEASN